MLDSSRPFALSAMNDRQPTRENILRSQSGLPLATPNGTVEWVRPSTAELSDRQPEPGVMAIPNQSRNPAPQYSTEASTASNNALTQPFRPSTAGQQPSANWTTWATSTTPSSHPSHSQRLTGDGGYPFDEGTLRKELNGRDFYRSSITSEMEKESDLETPPTSYRPNPSARHQSADIDIEKQSIDQGHNSQRQQSDEGDHEKDSQEEEQRDPNLVTWDGDDDPENPMNFKPSRKWRIAVMFGLMTFVVTFASSVFSSATMVTSMQFGVSSEVMTLGTSLFVLSVSTASQSS